MIPAPQRERIMQRHTLGQSIRRIAREENRARETVTKIVRSDDMRAYVTGLRERSTVLGTSLSAQWSTPCHSRRIRNLAIACSSISRSCRRHSREN